MPKKPPRSPPPPSVTSAPTELQLRKADVMKAALKKGTTEPSLEPYVDAAKTDEQAANTLGVTDDSEAYVPTEPKPFPNELAVIADPSATDESSAHRPIGRYVPVRSDRPRRRGARGQPERARLPLMPVLIGVAVLLAGFITWRVASRQPKIIIDASAKDAAATFQDAKSLIRKGQWKEAKLELDGLSTSAPQLEGLNDYLKAATAEVPSQEHLDAAEIAILHGELAHALTELLAVPDSSKQYFRRLELDAKLGHAVDEKVKVASQYASPVTDKERMRKLKATAEDILVARPNNRDAQILLATAERALGAKPVVAAPVDLGDPAARVMAEYAGGNSSGAFALAAACAGNNAHCGELKKQISEAQDLFKRLESLEEGELLHLVRLDRTLSGGKQSPNGKQAGVRLAAVLYPKASGAAARKQWGYAMSAARRVLEGDPLHEGAHGIVSEGREAAEELFHRCYVGRVQNPEESLPMCKEVVQMLPEGDEIRTKAQHILNPQ